ncbi:MAG: hypothetical protein Q8L48_03450 [Archangium sp.]|nr:hypothetical protein [Archangium sp.]
MFFFKACSVCRQTILVGWHRAGERLFCSSACLRSATHPGFCRACMDATEAEGAVVSSVDQMGTKLIGSWNRCKVCDSVESLEVVVFLVPILPVARFRVIRFGREGSDAAMLTRRIPGPAMTGAMWQRLAVLVVIAVLFWAVFIYVVAQGAP